MSIRKCDHCGREYKADSRNLKRGWGLTCSKSCAASKREKSRKDYDRLTVMKNNIKRANWIKELNKSQLEELFKKETVKELDKTLDDLGLGGL